MLHLFYQFYIIALRQKTKYKFISIQKNSFQQNVVLLKHKHNRGVQKAVHRNARTKANRNAQAKLVQRTKTSFLLRRGLWSAKALQKRSGAEQKRTGAYKNFVFVTGGAFCYAGAWSKFYDARTNKVCTIGGTLTSLEQQFNSQFLFINNNISRLNYNKKVSYLYPTNLEKMSFLSSDLANLNLSLKTYTFLKEKKIHKIGNLLKYSSRSLLQLLNKDREMFAEIKRCFLFTAIY